MTIGKATSNPLVVEAALWYGGNGVSVPAGVRLRYLIAVMLAAERFRKNSSGCSASGGSSRSTNVGCLCFGGFCGSDGCSGVVG